MSFHKELCYIVETHELYFTSISYQATTSAKIQWSEIGSENDSENCIPEKKTFTIKLLGAVNLFKMLLVVEKKFHDF